MFYIWGSVTYWKQLQAVISWLELFFRVFQWLFKMDCCHRFLSGMFEQMLCLPIFGGGFSTAAHECLALSSSSHRVSTPSLAKAKPFHRLTLGFTSIPLVWLFFASVTGLSFSIACEQALWERRKSFPRRLVSQILPFLNCRPWMDWSYQQWWSIRVISFAYLSLPVQWLSTRLCLWQYSHSN